MVFLSDVRKIDVANLIFVVEVDKQIAVADRDVSHDLLRGDCGFDSFVEFFLNLGAEADNLGNHSSFPVEDSCLWNIVAGREYKLRLSSSSGKPIG